jgi:hypothetical protein
VRLRGLAPRGQVLQTGGRVCCGLGVFVLALAVGSGSDPFFGLTFLALLLLLVGLPLLGLGAWVRRRSGPTFVWLPATAGPPPRRTPPAWLLAFVLPAVAGLALGLVGRVQGNRAESRQVEERAAAIAAHEREGRPVRDAVRACSAEVLGLQLPSKPPGATEDFARRVAACVLARSEATRLGFACQPENYLCSMPVTTRLPNGLRDAPEYGADYRDAVDEFNRSTG